MQIINDNNFVQLNKYYDLYSSMDRRQLENVVVRNMILNDKRFDSSNGKIPEDFYNRLMNRKSRVIEEEKKIRINMIKKFCVVNNDEDIENILKGIEPLLRNKKREILIMGGNYEEVKMEIEKEIVAFMTAMPKDSVQIEKSTMQIEEV